MALKISVFQLHRTFLARSIAAWTSWFTMTFCSGPLVVWYILVSCDHPSLLYCLVYFGFLRSSEFTVPHGTSYSPSLHLSHQDVAFDRRVDSSCLQVFIKVSKTNPFSAREHSGSGSFSLVSGRIATRLLGDPGSCRRPSVRPFQWRPPDTYSFYRASAPTDEPDCGHFGSHSFRIGAATTALTAGLAGVPEHMIQTLGRWSSSVYLAYRRTPRNLLASVTRVLC